MWFQGYVRGPGNSRGQGGGGLDDEITFQGVKIDLSFNVAVGWGVFVSLVEIPEGWGEGFISSLQKWKIQGGGGS